MQQLLRRLPGEVVETVLVATWNQRTGQLPLGKFTAPRQRMRLEILGKYRPAGSSGDLLDAWTIGCRHSPTYWRILWTDEPRRWQRSSLYCGYTKGVVELKRNGFQARCCRSCDCIQNISFGNRGVTQNGLTGMSFGVTCVKQLSTKGFLTVDLQS